MNFAEKAFWQTLYRLVMIQFGLVIGLALVLFSFYGKTGEFSIALIYGGFVSLFVTILRAWRLKIATEDADIAFDLNAAAQLGDALKKGGSESLLRKKGKVGDTGNDSKPESINSGINALELYKGFALGYIAAIALLAFGLAGLKLTPLAVIIGFVTAQLGHFFVRPPKPGAGRR